jgi:hypothetical protein
MNISVSPDLNEPWKEDAGATDYAEIFIDQMNCLYLLSFLITGDIQAAEKCLSKSLDVYVEARGGFMEWAKLHGRRAVLRHAIEIIKPVPRPASDWCPTGIARPQILASDQPFAVITSLRAFERFVFVMSVIEGLSVEECAALLNCSVQDVVMGGELARDTIAVEDLNCDLTGEMDLRYVQTLLDHQRCGIC